jgi:hypothetical protein
MIRFRLSKSLAEFKEPVNFDNGVAKKSSRRDSGVLVTKIWVVLFAIVIFGWWAVGDVDEEDIPDGGIVIEGSRQIGLEKASLVMLVRYFAPLWR